MNALLDLFLPQNQLLSAFLGLGNQFPRGVRKPFEWQLADSIYSRMLHQVDGLDRSLEILKVNGIWET